MDQAENRRPMRAPRDRYRDLPPLGHDLISPDRFISKKIHESEWVNLWSKVWLSGPRLEELPNPGDYIVEEWGTQSILFVRGADSIIRAFHNVCPHRGNQLVTARSSGRTAQIFCRYHGWRFDLDGSCKDIPDQEEFPQFAQGAPQCDVGLSEIRTDTWNGFVWFNLDPDCGALMDFIGPLAAHVASYDLPRQKLIAYVTWELPCNWKIVADAFNETYHFATQHPEMVQYGDDMPVFEFLGDHSVMKVEYGTVSEKVADRDSINPHMAVWMKAYYGFDSSNYHGPAKAVREAHCQRVRNQGGYGLADYSRLTDAQITDDWSYLCFPNTVWNLLAEGGATYRYRPHATDPNRCYFDLSMFRFFPEGAEAPKVTRKHLPLDADLAVDMPEMPSQGALAIAQDLASVGFVQKGMHSQGFRGMILGNQEIRLRHFYQAIDRWLASGA